MGLELVCLARQPPPFFFVKGASPTLLGLLGFCWEFEAVSSYRLGLMEATEKGVN